MHRSDVGGPVRSVEAQFLPRIVDLLCRSPRYVGQSMEGGANHELRRQSPYTGKPISEWYDEEIELHDADGDKIGNVVEVNPDFIVAQANTGFLGLGEPRNYFIPRSYIAREEEDDWYLSIDKDQIESMNWTNAPTDSEWSKEWRDGNSTLEAREGRTRLRRYEEE